MRVNKHTRQPLRFGLRQLRKTVQVQETLLSTVIRLVQTQDTLLNRQKRISTMLDDMSNQLDTLVRRQGWFMLRGMTGPESGRTLTGRLMVFPDQCRVKRSPSSLNRRKMTITGHLYCLNT